MADFNAIAAVSRTLRRLLMDRIATAGVAVTLAPPGVSVANINGSRVNLYLYQVEEHPSLQNQNIPGREHPAAYGHPPLSLRLRFLMTSHARSEDQADSDLIAQTLLGDAMLVLHDFGGRMDDLPLVTNRIGSIGDPVLDPVLRPEFERVKLVLNRTSVDELSKLWSAMPQANLRRAVIYEASVVQIEGGRPRRQAQPVEARRITAIISKPPRIIEAYRSPPLAPADSIHELRVAVGEEVTIEHAPVVSERLYVQFGTLELIRIPLPSNGRVRLVVPNAQYPVDLDHPAVRPIPSDLQLQPGPLEVALVSIVEVEGIEGGLDRGVTLRTERSLRSNTGLLQLVPSVASITPTSGDGAVIVRLTGERLWAEHLPSEVLVGDASIPIRPGLAWPDPTPTVVHIPASEIAAVLPSRPTPYSIAVQVNGARSREQGISFRLDP